MTNHLKTHNPDYISKKKSSARTKASKRYFTCWICPVRADFQSLDELKIHRKNLHHDFQCQFCKNGFMTNEALERHMLIHGTQDRPHLCKVVLFYSEFTMNSKLCLCRSVVEHFQKLDI